MAEAYIDENSKVVPAFRFDLAQAQVLPFGFVGTETSVSEPINSDLVRVATMTDCRITWGTNPIPASGDLDPALLVVTGHVEYLAWSPGDRIAVSKAGVSSGWLFIIPAV